MITNTHGSNVPTNPKTPKPQNPLAINILKRKSNEKIKLYFVIYLEYNSLSILLTFCCMLIGFDQLKELAFSFRIIDCKIISIIRVLYKSKYLSITRLAMLIRLSIDE